MRESRTEKRNVQVCFFGTYPASYTVSRILVQAAHDAGLVVHHCHDSFRETPLVSRELIRPAAVVTYIARYVRSASRLWPLLRRCPAQILVAGFRGQLDVLWASHLGYTRGRRLVFAPLVTVLETIEDRMVARHFPPIRRFLAWLDRQSLNLADRVVIDTHAHAEYLRSRLNVPPQKIRVFHLGADTSLFRYAPPRSRSETMHVLFYGSFLPLHGVPVILTAAKRLQGEHNIRFTLCGNGWQWTEMKKQLDAASLNNVTLLGWVDYGTIPQLIAQHDVCLGIFSDNQKARMVIPNKVYQCAAMGRPVVSADSPAVREVFTHGENIVLVPPNNPEALAEALIDLYRHPETREVLATNAAQLLSEQFSPSAQAKRFLSSFVEALV